MTKITDFPEISLAVDHGVKHLQHHLNSFVYSQSIAKDQALLKSLVSRAARYLQSLKVSELKVQKLTEQLTATQKIATANKDQLEKTKKQVVYHAGPSYSKLMTLLVNDSLKFQT